MKFKPMIESHTGRETPEALRKRLDETGYLFFRDFLDPESLLALRKEVLGICQKHGWLLPGSELMQGKGRSDAYSGWFEYTGVYKDIQLLERFHAMAQHPKIIDTLAAIFDDAVLPHPRNIMRVTLPGSVALTTPSHQDYVFIQGSQNFYTVWFPLSDCRRELGGLAIAPGTHKHGIYPTKQAGGTGGLCIDADDDRFEWHAGDFRLGDAIMFHSLTIHRALPNATPDTMRLSCDYRYQPLREKSVVWNSLRPHMQLYSWEEIYANWQSDAHEYYWMQHELLVGPEVPPNKVPPTV